MQPADLFRLLTLAAIWGASFLFMRIIVPVLGPIPSAFGRVTLGALGLLFFIVLMRVPLRFNGRMAHSLFLGVINSGVPFMMFMLAARVLPAGYSAILNSTVPVMAILIGATFFGERIVPLQVIGVAMGLAGVAVLTGTGPINVTPAVLGGVAACLVATACYAVAGFLTRRWINSGTLVDSRVVAFGSQVGAVLVVGAFLVWDVASAPAVALPEPTLGAWAALATLGLVCTSFAYVMYFKLLAAVGPMKAMTVTMLVPVFGVFWGWVFLGETLSLAHAIGGSMIAAAMWMVLRGGAAPAPSGNKQSTK